MPPAKAPHPRRRWRPSKGSGGLREARQGLPNLGCSPVPPGAQVRQQRGGTTVTRLFDTGAARKGAVCLGLTLPSSSSATQCALSMRSAHRSNRSAHGSARCSSRCTASTASSAPIGAGIGAALYRPRRERLLIERKNKTGSTPLDVLPRQTGSAPCCGLSGCAMPRLARYWRCYRANVALPDAYFRLSTSL